MRQLAVRLGVVLACVVVTVVAGAAPALGIPGYRAEITGLPAEFTADGDPVTFSVVVSRDLGGECESVRWSLLVRVDGMSLDQVGTARVEQGQAFPLDIRADGGTARLTDTQLDPGTLCQDSTVTADYQFSFDRNVIDGRVTFTAEAYDTDLRLLASANAGRDVVGVDGPEPAPGASEIGAEVDPPTDVDVDPPAGDGVGSAGGNGDDGNGDDGNGGGGIGQAVDAVPAGDTSGVPVAWFVVGALMVFVGFGLLLRVRARLLRSVGAVGPQPEQGVWPVTRYPSRYPSRRVPPALRRVSR